MPGLDILVVVFFVVVAFAIVVVLVEIVIIIEIVVGGVVVGAETDHVVGSVAGLGFGGAGGG